MSLSFTYWYFFFLKKFLYLTTCFALMCTADSTKEPIVSKISTMCNPSKYSESVVKWYESEIFMNLKSLSTVQIWSLHGNSRLLHYKFMSLYESIGTHIFRNLLCWHHPWRYPWRHQDSWYDHSRFHSLLLVSNGGTVPSSLPPTHHSTKHKLDFLLTVLSTEVYQIVWINLSNCRFRLLLFIPNSQVSGYDGIMFGSLYSNQQPLKFSPNILRLRQLKP